MYTIGKVSKTLGISVQSIRMYQKKGLVEPSYVDTETGYRYFGDDDFGKLWRVKILQSAGFKLKEIVELNDKSFEEIEALIVVKRNELKQTILEKQISLDYLNRKIEAFSDYKQPAKIQVKMINDRFGQDFLLDREGSAADHFNGLANIIGRYGINQEVAYLPSRRVTITDEGVFLKDLFAIHDRPSAGLSLQKGGPYICLKVKDRADTLEAYDEIKSYAKENDFTLRGDAIELILINNNLVDRDDFRLKEIQVAIMD